MIYEHMTNIENQTPDPWLLSLWQYPLVPKETKRKEESTELQQSFAHLTSSLLLSCLHLVQRYSECWSFVHRPCTHSKVKLVAHGVVTSSRQITEVIQLRARLVLGWVTGARVTLPAMCRGVGQASHIMLPLSAQQ